LGLTDGGLVRLRPRLWQLLPGASSLSSATTESVCESHDGAVWMGTSLGGVYRFLNGAVAFYGAKELQLTHVLSIVEDHSSNLWFGTSWNGAYQFQTNHFVQIFPETQFPGRINVIHEDPGQVLWFGCGSGLVSCRDGQWQKHSFGDSVDNVQVKTITTDRDRKM
jgi:ligand-binding sensor domain-containing protein